MAAYHRGVSESFLDRLGRRRPLLLDSAMGSELDRRGVDVRLPLWSARALSEAPETVLAIHRENVRAGADILTANTFRTRQGTVSGRARELTRIAVALAREAASEGGRRVAVAGSVSPLADCYRPDLVAPDAELERGHRDHVENLVAAGADLLLVETVNSIREVQAAATASARSGLPFLVSVVTNGRGALLSGEPLEDAVRAVLPLHPAAVGVNCVEVRRVADELVRAAAAAPELSLLAYGNVLTTAESPEDYAAAAEEWIALGAGVVGGCCGTTPAHTAALRAKIDTRAPV